ncbi:MAG: HD domain-containing protein, partial [Anaerolineaceae bacterium]
GDTYIYAPGDPAEQAAKEQAAAETLFGLLPPDQAQALKALWDEFEAIVTPEARFAKAMDRFLPILQNYRANGLSWREHHITPQMVEGIILKIKPGSQALWAYAHHLLAQAVERGLFEA